MQLIFQMEAQKNLTADDIENYITEKIANQPNKKYAKDLTEKLCENLDLIDATINKNASFSSSVSITNLWMIP